MSQENEKFKQKRILKNPIKFSIQLNEEQKEAKNKILKSKITVLKGQAGSGKSLLAVQTALDLFFRQEFEKIIITRPLVTSGEDIGFLPGDIKSKTDPFTAPIMDACYRLYSKDKIDKEIQEGNIEVIPFAFMRGRNFSDCVVVVDEAQNITDNQMELLLGRMCIGSKMIICGDTTQIDLKEKKNSGFDFICKHMKDVNDFSVITLKTNHRDPIVEDILKIYSDFR